MPSQIKIITAVNRCLKQMKGIEFQLDSAGICNGLSGLFIKYALENKTDTFFQILNQLSKLPADYKTGQNSVLDNFICQMETTYNTNEYQQNLLQSDIDKVLFADGKPFKNEYNIGLITNQIQWEKIIQDISKPNRAYFVGSVQHAIGFFFKHNKYNLYDPNYKKRTKAFANPKDLLSEIKECFNFQESKFGMSIRVFAPQNESLLEYPLKSTIHDLVFKNVTKNDESYRLACDAKDIETLNYLRLHKAINWQNLESKLLDNLLIQQFLQEPPSATQKTVLLDMISFNLWHAYSDNLTILLNYYNKRYTQKSDKIALKKSFEIFFQHLGEADMLGPVIRKKRDYSTVLESANSLDLNENIRLLPVLTHLHFLTLLHTNAETKNYEALIKHHTDANIIEQIKLAAFANHSKAIDILLEECTKRGIKPANYASIFTKAMLETINPYVFEKLVKANFPIDSSVTDLAIVCASRSEEKILDLYLKTVAEKDDDWKAIYDHDTKKIDLKKAINTSNYLHILIQLDKTYLIEKAWKNNFTADELTNAFKVAITKNHKEICQFLITKLQEMHASIDDTTLESLLDEAILERNMTTLEILSEIPGFNLLKDTKKINSILWICSIHDNFNVVDKAFNCASTEAQLRVLKTCLTYSYKDFLEKKFKESPDLFTLLLKEWIPKQDADRDRIISRIDKSIQRWFSGNDFSINLPDKNIKPFIAHCFTKNYLGIAKKLFITQYYTDEELATLYSQLVAEENASGLLFLLNHSFDRRTFDFFQLAQIAVKKNNTALLITLINSQSEFLEPFIANLLLIAVKNGHHEAIQTIATKYPHYKIDYKALFVSSCQQKQVKLANALLAESFELTTKARRQAIFDLFGSQTAEEIYQKVYSEGYGRLYSILLQLGVENPKSELIASIKEPLKDSKIQDTNLFEPSINDLLRALKAGDTNPLFSELFTHFYRSCQLNKSVLKLIEYPFTTEAQYHLIIAKFPIEDLLEYALENGAWASAANLLNNISEKDLNPYLMSQIKANSDAIVLGYLSNLQKNYAEKDVRPILFALLTPSQKPTVLSSFLNTKSQWINEMILSVQNQMQADKIPLTNIYKLSLDENNQNNVIGFAEAIKQPSKPTPNPISTIPGRQKYLGAVREYLYNRDKTLSIFSYYFDYKRGKIRAEHYKNLIKKAQSSKELNLIIFAIITNPNGQRLQKNMITALGCANADAAIKKLSGLIGNVDLHNKQSTIYQCVAAINKKANAANATLTETLFASEIKEMKALLNTPPQHTPRFFKPPVSKKQSLFERIFSFIVFK